MKKISRRSALSTLSAGAAAITASAATVPLRGQAAEGAANTKLKGHVNHSVCKWCYGKIPLDEFCGSAKDLGIKSVELLEVKDFPVLKNHGLVCAMVSGVPGGITSGLNRVENHEKIIKFFETTAPVVADHGYPNIICFS